MRKTRNKFITGAAIMAIFAAPAWALEQGCFNFLAEKPKPLHEPLPLLENKVNGSFGTKDNGVVWGAARGLVKRPILFVLDKFLDHRIVKDMSKTELSVEKESAPGYLELHKVNLKVDVLSWASIRWKESWAYIVEEGTPKAPKRLHIFYQKIDGTRHIQHQCGEFIVIAKGPDLTDVYLYEQVRATRRDGEATMRMHYSTIDKLKTGKIQ